MFSTNKTTKKKPKKGGEMGMRNLRKEPEKNYTSNIYKLKIMGKKICRYAN